jgi:hypothetical protein
MAIWADALLKLAACNQIVLRAASVLTGADVAATAPLPQLSESRRHLRDRDRSRGAITVRFAPRILPAVVDLPRRNR